MARVFISHSSRDNEAAARIKTWLHEQGFEAPFLDFDKHAGIPPGAGWERTLYREIEQSEAVIIVQTPNWLESKWCFAEFTQARALGKPIFPLIETPNGETLVSPDIQALDLRRDREGGLERLARQLTRIALDAQGGFTWDASRPPYPGLLAFQEEDAAIYFGRDDDIRRLMERLEARRAQGGARLVALLGASGSGKSSLLRAGVIPRLRRAGRNWIVVPPLRPQLHPVDELARALAIAGGPHSDWRQLRGALLDGDPARLLGQLAGDLRVQARANEAEILLPIDQAEELFGAADPAQARRLLQIVSRAAAGDLPFITVLAMRSDYLGDLQSATDLATRFEEFSLGPIPKARIAQIIQGPARVAGLAVDEALVRQAVSDAETEDALPLLAFALRELYDRAAGDNYLSLEEYNALGDQAAGLTPLENAVRKAAEGVLADARPPADELAALRDAFVPAMVRVNDQSEFVRRPAVWDDLPARAQRLLERLAAARLLIIRQDGDHCVIEVAHEALLRKWPLLRAWLEDAREFLVGRQQLDQDLQDWTRAAEPVKKSALLAGLKLNRARGWLADRPHQLTAAERAYIQASIQVAEAEAVAKLRQRRNITRAAAGAAMVLAGVAFLAGYQWLQAEKAAHDLARAAQERTEELILYAWTDLGAKENQAAGLTTLALELGRDPNELIQELAGPQPDGFDCRTTLPAGFRHLYCSVRNVISFQKLQAISGLQVFSSGPHGQELDLADQERFGHYNPFFLDWVADNLEPRFGDAEAWLRPVTERVYRAFLGPTARALYRTHRVLFASPEYFKAVERDYERLKKTHFTGSGGIGQFATDPVPFENVKRAYRERLAQPVDDRPKDQYGGNSNGIFLENSFFWLSDYLLAVHSPDECCGDWYLASASAGFWVRRSIDGTEPRIFELVSRLLQNFEPEVLEAP